MINHNFPHLNLDKKTKGTQTLPFETNRPHNTVSFASDLKKFIVTAYREYTYKTIKANSKLTGSNFTLHSKKNTPISNKNQLVSYNNKQENKDYDNLPFFIIKIIGFNKININAPLGERINQDNVIMNQIATTLSYSNIKGIRGNRGVFVTRLTYPEDNNYIFTCFAFISRAIFYNDYRVTVNFPAFMDDYKNTLKKISHQFNSNQQLLTNAEILEITLETP